MTAHPVALSVVLPPHGSLHQEDQICTLADVIDIRGPFYSGYADVSVERLLALLDRIQGVRRLDLRFVVLRDSSPDSTRPELTYTSLDTLAVGPFLAVSFPSATVSEYLFDAFAHMPRLRILIVEAPDDRQYIEPANRTMRLQDPPFSLETFVCCGTLATLACARIIMRSRRTLKDLLVQLPGSLDGYEDGKLAAAMAEAAPHLQTLCIHTAGGTDFVRRFGSVFAALSRIRSLYLAMPGNVALPTTLKLISLAPKEVSLRTLELSNECVIGRHHGTWELDARDDRQDIIRLLRQLLDETPQTRHVTDVIFTGIFAYCPHEKHEMDKLMERWRARRIRCQIVEYS